MEKLFKNKNVIVTDKIKKHLNSSQFSQRAFKTKE